MRVIELSDEHNAAAYCGKLFARWGAKVIRLQPPSSGDDSSVDRARELYLHGGKQRVAFDWQDLGNRAELDALVPGADLLVTDASPSEIEKLGLLSIGGDAPPDIIVSITPFGLSGPYKDYQATASTLLALGGYTFLMGDPGRTPLTMPGNYAYYQAGTFAYIAGLAAHMAAIRATGEEGASSRRRPRVVEVSALECLASLHQATDTMWNFGGVVRSRHGNRWENLHPTALHKCSDGWFGTAVGQNFWFQFALMMGHPEYADPDHPFSTNDGRMAHLPELEAAIVDTVGRWPKHRIFKEGQEVWRVPVGHAASLQEVLDDPHLNERGFWQSLSEAGAGGHPIRTPGTPYRLTGEPTPREELAQAPVNAKDLALRDSDDPERSTAGLGRERPSPQDIPALHEPFTAKGPYQAGHEPARPLAGIRVLDLTRVWSGPVAARILGDLGAEVIKVEAPDGRGGGQTNRPTTGGHPWNMQPLFNKLQRNRLGLVLDLKSAEGREVFLRLVRESDIVLENFSARALPSLGLGYEALREANPQVIYVAMPAFGLSGPYKEYIGLGPSIEPTTGLTALMGYSRDEARATSKAVTDPAAGTAAAAAAMMALERRERTGHGAFVELSQHECGVATLGEFFIERQLKGIEPERIGNTHPTYAPNGIYRCAGDDEWIALAVRGDADWSALCKLAGEAGEELMADPRFSDTRSRREHQRELDDALNRWTRLWEKRDLMQALQSRGIPAGAILSAPEWLNDPHLVARGYFVDLVHAETGTNRWDGSPISFDGERGYEHWSAAPLFGEHNILVLSALGFSPEEIERLNATGVIADMPRHD